MTRESQIRLDYKPRPIVATTARATRLWRPLMLLPLVVASLTFALTHNPSTSVLTDSGEPVAVSPELESLPGVKLDFTVKRNDTLERIFRRLQLSLADLTHILALPAARQALNRIQPGDTVTVYHADGAVHALHRRISETEMLSVTRAEQGFTAEVITTPIEFRVVHAQGTIETSLFVAARNAGVNPETILQLANDIFGWEIDFALDIRPGDRFHLVYEQKYRDGNYLGDARILAAEFVNAGETHHAVYYKSDDGRINGFFSPDGRSMRRQFLRAPVDFRRVSSNFNPRRRHPILRTVRAHQGVDYVAAPGTPIMAAGDGRVSFAGVNGGYGNTILLEHGGGISTLYAHLSGFARGVRHGQRVTQGQTIGYVGSTGTATGPHLHYEYRVNGIHKNPRTVHLPDAAPIPQQYFADFQATATARIAVLEQGGPAGTGSLASHEMPEEERVATGP